MKRGWTVSSLLVVASVLGGCASSIRFSTAASSAQYPPTTPATLRHVTMRGIASYYHDDFHGRRTASGEIFRQDQLMAAHPTLPFGTLVQVRNLRNGRSVVVRITDRGPHGRGRIVDVSRAAAAELDMIADGLAEVELTIVELPR